MESISLKRLDQLRAPNPKHGYGKARVWVCRYGVRLLNLINLDTRAVGLIDEMDGATAAIVCTGDSLSRDRTWVTIGRRHSFRHFRVRPRQVLDLLILDRLF
jgi:hypothetical protein